MGLIAEIFTWWNGQTLGTRLFTWRRGEKVGEDAEGNVFYQSRDGKRRWVIFDGLSEASRVSPDWHGWLHHTYSEPPTKDPLPRKAWEKDHVANVTGTSAAYQPAGSILGDSRAKADYEAWVPE